MIRTAADSKRKFGSERARRTSKTLVVAAFVGGGALLGLLAVEQGRLAVSLTLLFLFGSLVRLQPALAIITGLSYLAIMGDVRRALIPLLGWSGKDPLLLVGPVVVVVLLVGPLARGRLQLDTQLSRWVAGLMVIMVLQMFNPKQGGLAVGVAGALFYVVPLLWFWVGRAYGSAELLKVKLYRVTVPIAVAGCLLGLYQAFVGLLPYQQAWVDVAGYRALNVGGYTRAFSFFTSAAEYTHYMGVAFVVIWAGFLSRYRPSYAILLPLLGGGILLAGTRTVVILTLLSCTVLWAIQGRSISAWLPRLAVGAVIGATGLLGVLPFLSGGDGSAGAAIDHQVAGFTDVENSTLSTHTGLFVGGILRGFRAPLGHGLGATTNAASQFGGEALGTERDLSNMFVSLGVIGGLVYAVLIGLVLWRTALLWRDTRGVASLALMGILVVELGLWLYGSHYAITALIWFCIGSMDRVTVREAYD